MYASPRRCKALLDAAIAAAKRTSALSAEEMIAQANTTTTTVATTSSPAVEGGNAMEKKEEDKKENIEISRSFDARRLRRKRRINRGGRVKMSAFSKRREQESAKYRYGGAAWPGKRLRDIRNYEVASESDGTDDDDDDYYDDEEQGVVEGMAQQQSWKSLNRPISTNPTTTSRTITTIITTAVLACAEVVSPDGASSNILT